MISTQHKHIFLLIVLVSRPFVFYMGGGLLFGGGDQNRVKTLFTSGAHLGTSLRCAWYYLSWLLRVSDCMDRA
jgi:hypothetical protein